MQIDSARTKIDKTIQYMTEIASSVRIILSKKLAKNDFQSGALRLACVAQLPNLQLTREYRTEVVAALAGRNQRLAKELPSRYRNASVSDMSIEAPMTVLLIVVYCFQYLLLL